MTIGFMLSGLFALVLLNVPIAVALGLVAMTAIVLMQGIDMLPNIALVMFDGATNFPLLAIPLFILAGAIMNASSISRRLVAFASALFGFVRGGLSMVVIGASMFFAEISGSAVAGVAALGTILIPAMRARGYSKEFSAAICSSASSLAIIIPPSIPMILYAVSAEVSIGELFIAGIGPGILIAAALTLFVYVWCRIKGLGRNDREGQLKFTAALKRSAFALLMPVVIIGGIYGGVFTPTEASVVAVFYALVVGMVIYREIRFADLAPILRKSVISSAIIMFIIANAGLFSFLINRAGVPVAVGEWLVQTIATGAGFLLAVNGFLFVLGMFVETSAAIIVLAPILAPVASHFGIDPIHFGLIMVVNLAMGMITPPFGVNLFAACQVARIPLDRIVAPLVPFVLVILACLLIVTYVPEVSLLFRDLLY